MLEFLKNLFSKKETIKEEVELEKLSDWFTNNTKKEVQELNNQINQYAEDMKQEIKLLQQSLIELENAQPTPGLKIMPKVIHVVEGHRKNYITRLNLFMERIIVPESLNSIIAKEYCKTVDEELDQIAKNTVRSYFATQHLFHQPLEEVTKNLKSITNHSTEIRNLSKQPRIKMITNIKKDIKEIEKGKVMTITMTEEIQSTEKRKKTLDLLREQTHEQLQKVIDGEEYKSYNHLQKKKKELEDKKRLEESKLFNIFSSLDAALKKYERMSLDDTKLVLEYIEYPVKALVEDKNLQILHILDKIRKNVEEGRIELKEDKKIRTIKAIQNIQEQNLKEFVKQYKELLHEIKEIEAEINASAGSQLEERHLKDKLLRTEKDMELTSLSIQTIQEKMKNMAFEKTKKEVINGIKELLEIELEIK